ncbi:MAG: DUF1801 domain-containing protein [Blastococcus sp.]|nr:DUF1801 domain-containing protein [Blastococcus sp.]
MPRAADDVDDYLDRLQHPLKAGVEQLRAAILASDAGITESVKWNAPNFRHDGVDRVTFRLQPGNRLQLVLHRGAAVRADAADFRFDDPTGLVQWAAPDRGVLTFRDLDDVAAKEAAVVELVRRWMSA